MSFASSGPYHWETAFTPAALNRGRRYVIEGDVFDLIVMDEGCFIAAAVQGKNQDPHEVEIELYRTPEGELRYAESYCTCPNSQRFPWWDLPGGFGTADIDGVPVHYAHLSFDYNAFAGSSAFGR